MMVLASIKSLAAESISPVVKSHVTQRERQDLEVLPAAACLRVCSWNPCGCGVLVRAACRAGPQQDLVLAALNSVEQKIWPGLSCHCSTRQTAQACSSEAWDKHTHVTDHFKLLLLRDAFSLHLTTAHILYLYMSCVCTCLAVLVYCSAVLIERQRQGLPSG